MERIYEGLRPLPLTEKEKDELRSIAAHSKANPGVGVSWQELRADMRETL